MQRNSNYFFMCGVVALFCLAFQMKTVFAGIPLWHLEPLTTTTIEVPSNGTAIVKYRVTNQSNRPRSLVMKPISAITQITTGYNVCGNPFVLTSKSSCILSLQINGSQLNNPITEGPVVCARGSTQQCYRPSANYTLHSTQAPPITDAVITVSESPLTLAPSGADGQLTINNTSTEVTATNIISTFTGTALDGNVTETANTCANVPPSSSCTITYTPGNTPVAQTNFTIQGTNTNVLTASMSIATPSTLASINPVSGTASGGVGFTLTGTGLTGATGVTFAGVAATSVNVVNSTTVTGVTPAHAAGAVNVVINTPSSWATLTNGYTYLATAVGQSSGGGTIGCLGGGLNNLIASTTYVSTSAVWGMIGTSIPAAQSGVDGASNTSAIVTFIEANGSNGGAPYAAKLCYDYEVDSLGNSPCQAGNTCYNDWFLPADNGNQLGQLSCLYTNRAVLGFSDAGNFYWTSTERSDSAPANKAWYMGMGLAAGDGIVKTGALKDFATYVRCVRAFTP